MASLITYSFLLVLFFTSGVVIATKKNEEFIIENNCEFKMDLSCVSEVFDSIFKTGNVTNKCCGELLVLGKKCHHALVKRTLENPIFKSLDRKTIMHKSITTWSKCHELSRSPSLSA
ncbi:hypothetical protein GQ457_17G012170 [Hibiscus cannabinus]